jgi:ADP-ribose pyrophosphatase YjhB (NUDIX family)
MSDPNTLRKRKQELPIKVAGISPEPSQIPSTGGKPPPPSTDKVPQRRSPKPKCSKYVIASYGIILFAMVAGEPKFLVYQRRDNYEYIDILRGNWYSEGRFKELASVLSRDEKQRLREYTFKELWDDLWINHSSYIHNDGYDKAIKKYQTIRSKIPEIMDDVSVSFNSDPPWGFPKGKKLDQKHETDLECALREFSEETRLPVDELTIWDVRPFSEVYRGNNDKYYSTYYFLAEVPSELEITKISTPQCIRQEAISEEAADARWLGCSEACLKLAPRRQTMLKKIVHLIKTKYNELSPLAPNTEEKD